jgi:hypothetical protein
MSEKKIILVTGQSGIQVKHCLNKLIPEGHVSIEKKIEEVGSISFLEFLELPQYRQYEYWHKAFEEIYSSKLDPKPDKPVFLTFHAAYYHQKKRELFSPVNFESVLKLKDKVKMLIVFIDDIYDVYRRLMCKNQMFEDIIDREKTKPLDAIFASVFNIISLLNWREMEITLSRTIANLLNAKMLVVSTKHPIFMVERLVKEPLENLKLYYLSHPITAIREEAATVLSSFVGKLEASVEKILSFPNVVLFFPTTIDELIIKKDKKTDNGYHFYPELMPRWSHPFKEKLLSPTLPKEVKDINPLNPLNLSLGKGDTISDAVSTLISLLWKYIYLKQIISRDYSLVEQSDNGIIAFRPYFEGIRAGGVIGELSYNFSLMSKDKNRMAYIFSCKEDWNKLVINRLFTTSGIVTYLKNPPITLKNHQSEWLQRNLDITAKSAEEIRNDFEKSVLPSDYDFDLGKKQDEWHGDTLSKKLARRKEGFKKIWTDIRTDEIKAMVEDRDLSERVKYSECAENDFMNNTHKLIEELFKHKGG